ncbi:hypothetical protein HPB47_026012 [Ixodes persulcatus]|uniref:Uncharacterized protein n=1 Tax=Ixodes persulcatus TaxID=34615 RepID=A0AC60PZY4_IXOPE|nr:hypothetical protein HPB47_026012 [Ixodes persulcatus]
MLEAKALQERLSSICTAYSNKQAAGRTPAVLDDLSNKNKLTPDASSGPSGDFEVSSESSRSRRHPFTTELHECEYCLAVFPERNRLERHVAIHTGDTPYQCRFCPMSFAGKDDPHEARPVTRRRTAVQLCPKCSSSFYLKSSFDAHLKYHVPHQCSLCSASFSGEDELARHSRSHVGEPLFKRGTYAAVFHTGALRDAPTIAHTPQTMHKCPRCPRAFPLRSSLEAHLECHSLYRCHFCPVFFADEASLARHVCSRKRHVLWRSHVKKHPFMCRTCAARFRTMTELVVHGLTHASKKRHRCPQCTSSFYLRLGTASESLLNSAEEGRRLCQVARLPQEKNLGGVHNPRMCLQSPCSLIDIWHLKLHVKMYQWKYLGNLRIQIVVGHLQDDPCAGFVERERQRR